MIKKIIIVILSVLMTAGGFVILKNRNYKDIPAVRIVKISNEDISENLKFEGIVNSRKTYGLYKKVPMMIEEVNIHPGTMVKKGDELIVFSGVGSNGFENTGVSSIFIKLEEKKLEVEVLKKQLTELERKKRL